jgi:hypothetical protein
MANRVTWTIRDFPAGGLVLVRDRLLRNPGETPVSQTIDTVEANAQRAVELIVMHVPVSEADSFLVDIGAPPLRRRMRVEKEASARASRTAHASARADTFATHFAAYYDLLGAQTQDERPIPRLLGRVRDPATQQPRRCSFTVAGLGLVPREITGLETLSCMVASADPP